MLLLVARVATPSLYLEHHSYLHFGHCICNARAYLSLQLRCRIYRSCLPRFAFVAPSITRACLPRRWFTTERGSSRWNAMSALNMFIRSGSPISKFLFRNFSKRSKDLRIRRNVFSNSLLSISPRPTMRTPTLLRYIPSTSPNPKSLAARRAITCDLFKAWY